MTVRQFLSWLTCHDKATLVAAGVLNPNVAMNFLHRIREMIPKALAKGKDRALAVMYDLFAQFPKDAFEIPEEAEEIYSVYLIQTERLIRYFFDTGRTLVSAEPKIYSTYVPGLEDEVSGRVDITAKNANGITEYITLDVFHKNVYKQKARKPCNKPENAPELVLPAVAIADAGAIYEVWYLKGCEDKKGEFPDFEIKDGANIAYCDFKAGDLSIAKKNLETLVEINPEERKCEGCLYQKVCKTYPDTAPAASKTDTAAAVKMGKEVRLTSEQQEVADFREGALCVVAIPGSGKTKTLVSRMLAMVNDGIPISNILFVTFTNKACGEIAGRVRDAVGKLADDANIKTFNGLGYDILKANEKLLGRPVQLAQEATRRNLIRTVILNPNNRMAGVNMAALDGEFGLVKRVDDWILLFEQYGCSEERFRDKYPNIDFEGFLRVYESYKEEFKLKGYINYDDQIRMVVELFEEHPELAAQYSKIFEYCMVDEFQDVNKEQVRLLQLLCTHGNIVAVGDDDQAIYQFRGGSNEFMLNFSSYFKGARTVGLTKNFRSNDKIVQAAEACIAHNGTRINKHLRASFTAKLKPVLLNAPGNELLVKQYILPMAKAYGARNIAIIARRNSELSDIRPFLEEAGILSTNPKDYICADKSFMLLYDLLSIYRVGMSDASESFTRLYSSFVTNEKVEAVFGESFYSALIRLGKLKPLLPVVHAVKAYNSEEGKVGEFGRKILRTFELFDYNVDPKETFESTLRLWFPDADSNTLLAANMISKQCEEAGISRIGDVYNLMDAMVRYADKTRIMYDYGDAVNLLTAHDSKGKEFAGVVVLNGDRFIDTDEEGRRVLYVAITRAKHTLVVTSSGDATNHLIFEELGDSVTVAL